MFKNKGALFPALLISLLGRLPATAQDAAWDPSCPYTLASLQGSYAVQVNYGPSVAIGLQIQTLDGKGNLTRNGVLNQPVVGSSTGARTVGTVTSKGTYTVNCDGSGTISRVVTRPDGTTAFAIDDFIITAATRQPGQGPVASTIIDAQRDPSVILPGGIFVTRVHTRLPEISPQKL